MSVVKSPRLPAKPSTPSIKLKELVITIIVKKERVTLANCGISCKPRNPCMLVISTPP